jgi:hypothetical protein
MDKNHIINYKDITIRFIAQQRLLIKIYKLLMITFVG